MGKRGPLPDTKRRTAPKGRIPKMPQHLGPVGQRLWKRVVNGLKDRKAVGSLHIDALTDACDLADDIDALKKDIQINGGFYECKGSECMRPQVKSLATNRRLMFQYMTKFGLSPMDDERLNGPPEPEKEESAFAKLSKMDFADN
jgi:P27 family predicted phage terminase small subunit